MTERLTHRLRITGRVQGVGYRYSMMAEAGRLGVTGWVRNCRDGSVEALVSGSPDQIDALLVWARRGPPAALVEDVAVAPDAGEFASFNALPDA
jgi:acylphosphatase